VFSSFKISRFRCFKELSLDQIDRINLIVGKNNVGKTALLEALFLHCGGANPELALRINFFRGIEAKKVELTPWTESPWDSLFYNFETSSTVEIVGEHSQLGKMRLKMKVLRDLEELKKLSYTLSSQISRVKEEPEIYRMQLGRTESAKVLEFSYEQKNISTKTYMIIDPKGVRLEPFPPAPPFPAFFQASKIRISPGEEAERFGQLEIKEKQDLLLKMLKIIESRLKRIFVIFQAGESVLHGDVGSGRPIPLPLMGEGMVKLTNMILHIGNAPNGVVLIDEIDNGIHHSILKKVWMAIAEAAREFKVQLFATTHSMECIVAAHEAFSESETYDFRLVRLEQSDDTIRAITYDRNTLETAISCEIEVR